MTLLARRAQAKIGKADKPAACSLLEYVGRTSPELDTPNHLAPIADALERAVYKPIRLCFSVPPQHGKSTLIFHFIAWVLSSLRHLRRDLIYLTYNDDFATTQARIARRIAERGGVRFDPSSRALCEWLTQDGGTFFAGGIGGGVTGRPGGIVIVDDPTKNWVEAQSPSYRDRMDFDFRTGIMTRLHDNSSAIVVQTRWNVDDLIGRRVHDGWEYINLPAIDEDGKALWPARRPMEFLDRQRSAEGLGELLFAAMYQGRPVPFGGEVFRSPALCTMADIPKMGQPALGVDLAYSGKTKSDYSIRIVLQRNGEFLYVADVVRKQCTAPEFATMLRMESGQYPGAPMWWHAAGTERGSADFIIAQGVPLHFEPATSDKFVRAQEAAKLWNAGKIVVPSDAPWSQVFIRELMQFTGRGDAHDDQVDALVSAVAAASARVTGTIKTLQPRATGGLRSAY
jgi:predicted phage terminase large subunit-like protein